VWKPELRAGQGLTLRSLALRVGLPRVLAAGTGNFVDTDCRALSCLVAIEAGDAYEPALLGVIVGIRV
jgi:hypothetical protein